jgi:hypothetical protein
MFTGEYGFILSLNTGINLQDATLVKLTLYIRKAAGVIYSREYPRASMATMSNGVLAFEVPQDLFNAPGDYSVQMVYEWFDTTTRVRKSDISRLPRVRKPIA